MRCGRVVLIFLPIMAKTPENASKQNGTNGGEQKTDNIVQRVTPIRAMLFPWARHALLPKGLWILRWKGKICCFCCRFTQFRRQSFIPSASTKRIEAHKQTNKQTPQQVSAASSSHLTNIFFQEKQTTTILASIAIEQIGIRFRGQFICVNNIPPNHQILCRGHYQNQAPPASTLPCADDPNSSNARALPDTILLLLIAGGWQRLCKNWLHLLVQRRIGINFGKINPKACFRSMGGNIKHPCWRV